MMGHFVSYILQSSLALICFYLVYKLLLAGEKQHSVNRAVLLACYVAAFLLPFAHSMIPSDPSPAAGPSATVGVGAPLVWADTLPGESRAVWPVVVIAVYFTGVAVMVALTLWIYMRLWRLVSVGRKTPRPGYTIVELPADCGTAPFSWRGYVFVCENVESVPEAVIAHELEHLRRGHWMDMLAAQCVIVLQWMNPAAWLMRREMRTVHEYQADSAVIRSGYSLRMYQMMLIEKAVGRRFPALANSLNHSNLKKRITMMLKSESRKRRRWLALALVPAAAVALTVFNISAVASVASQLETDDAGAESASDGKVTIFSETSVSPEENKTQHSMSVTILPEGNSDAGILDDALTVVARSAAAGADTDTTLYVGDTQVSVKATRRISKDGKATNLVLPSFPGGITGLMEELARIMRYPVDPAKYPGLHRVVVRFVIDEQGRVTEPEIVRSAGDEFDREALRAVCELPEFIPGTSEGKPVKTHYVLPVNFKAQ